MHSLRPQAVCFTDLCLYVRSLNEGRQCETYPCACMQEGSALDFRVHNGFLRRARAVSIEALHRHAASQGLRLVLCGTALCLAHPARRVLPPILAVLIGWLACLGSNRSAQHQARCRGSVCVVLNVHSAAGHSLGGAVAQICTLDLLRKLRQRGDSMEGIACIAYASPAVGNRALAAGVQDMGWGAHFINYSLPGESPIKRTILHSCAWCGVNGSVLLPASCAASIVLSDFQIV